MQKIWTIYVHNNHNYLTLALLIIYEMIYTFQKTLSSKVGGQNEKCTCIYEVEVTLIFFLVEVS